MTLNTEFAKNLNLSHAEIRTLENLTTEQISAIRRNTNCDSDQEAVDAAAQYLADGGELTDLLA